MKVKIKVTYNLHDQEGVPPEIERLIKEKMKEIRAEFYGGGINHNTGERDLTFGLELEEK